MIREIVKIDEDKCDGCGLCIPNCHEGALQIIDGKAVLVSDLMCDGLGACLGHCPQGAIEIETREADPYDEVEVVKDIIPKGKNVMIAHLKHLSDHNEHDFFRQAIEYLEANRKNLPWDLTEVKSAVHKVRTEKPSSCGCAGSAEKTFDSPQDCQSLGDVPSALTHWPVQMHLVNPNAQHFKNSDLLLAADCVAFCMGNFHQTILKGKTMAIMCPKLDTRTESYVEKITSLIDDAKVNTITVAVMEVPCCNGLLRFVQQALQNAKRKVPVKIIVVSAAGKILNEEWV
ncbi:MAG: 4Fe-4S binding protein [Bacteroidales bacterium]|nr:4Fe-4S binding protein [Bacteroidales bacterium]